MVTQTVRHDWACTCMHTYYIKNLPNTLKIEVNNVHPLRHIVKTKQSSENTIFSFERRGQFWRTRSISDMNDGVSHFNRLTLNELFNLTQPDDGLNNWLFLQIHKCLALICTIYLKCNIEKFWISADFFWNSAHV